MEVWYILTSYNLMKYMFASYTVANMTSHKMEALPSYIFMVNLLQPKLPLIIIIIIQILVDKIVSLVDVQNEIHFSQ